MSFGSSVGNDNHADRRLNALVAGFLIAACVCVLLFVALAYLIPRYLILTDGPYGKVLPALSILFVAAGSIVQQRRRKFRASRSLQSK